MTVASVVGALSSSDISSEDGDEAGVLNKRANNVDGIAMPIPEFDIVGGIGRRVDESPGTEAVRIPIWNP